MWIDVRKQHQVDLSRARKELPIIAGWRYEKIRKYANIAYENGFSRQAECFVINCWRHLKYRNQHGCDELIQSFYHYVIMEITV